MNTSAKKMPAPEDPGCIEYLNDLLDELSESPLDLREMPREGEPGSPGSSFVVLSNGEVPREIDWVSKWESGNSSTNAPVLAQPRETSTTKENDR